VELPDQEALARLVREERFAELEGVIEELRQDKPELRERYSYLSRAYRSLGSVSRNAPDEAWLQYITHLKKWADAYEDSVAPRILLGKVYCSYAWKARGGGYSASVTEEGWRLFAERLQIAQRYLEQAGKLPKQDPECYRELITVAKGLNWPKSQMEAAFKKGVALEPNYQQLYEAKADYLLARWHGEPGEWEAFAEKAANARGGEEGDLLYMAIAKSNAWTEREDFFKNTSISYPRMKRGFELRLKANPENEWNLNQYCYFACIAEDRETAKNLFPRINGRWEKEVWSNEARFQQWQDWATSNGHAPVAAAPARHARAPLSSEQVKSALLITGAIWLGIVVLVAAFVWSIVRNHQKSR